jgi:hypothetical protein
MKCHLGITAQVLTADDGIGIASHVILKMILRLKHSRFMMVRIR